jgi:phage shock protein C
MDNRKLYRSRTHRVIAGVCGGLGGYFDIDPVLVRALFVVAALGGGFGLLMYIVLWMVIPEEPRGEGIREGDEVKENKGGEEGIAERRNIGGIALIMLGAIFLFNNFMPHWDFSRLWPALLIAGGVVLLARR